MRVELPSSPIKLGLFINNESVEGKGVKRQIISPYNGAIIGEFHEATLEQMEKAVQSAVIAQKDWAKMPIKERSKVMFDFRQILLRDIDKISHLKSAESGKTFNEGKAGLLKGIEVLEFALSMQNLDLGGKLEVSRGVTCEYRRKALGVVLNITPFNFPAMVPMWTIPIALTLGNAYIWKPSDKTPLTSMLIANALKEAGLPSGLFQVIHGGKDVVESLIDHKDIKAVGFVGSSPVAKAVYQRATQNGKRALAMGGAKNHIVLLPDANIDIAGVGISDSFTGCAGQRCMAASVLLAVGETEKHIGKIIERASSLKLGSDMGAIITKEQKDFLVAAIGRAEASGAKILLDGRKATAPHGMEGGNWLGATVIDFVAAGSEAQTRELFGPILSIIRCKDISEAIKIQNSSEYGNACSVFTSNGALAELVAENATVGMVGINVGVPVPREPFSFGGVNISKYGHGDITGHHSLDFWSDVKKVTIKWEKQNDSTWMS